MRRWRTRRRWRAASSPRSRIPSAARSAPWHPRCGWRGHRRGFAAARPTSITAPLKALGHRGLLTVGITALLYNFGFFTLLAFTPFPLAMGAHEIGFIFFGWGLLLAITSVFVAPMVQRRFGTMAGIVGALLAVPFVAFLNATIQALRTGPAAPPPEPDLPDALAYEPGKSPPDGPSSGRSHPPRRSPPLRTGSGWPAARAGSPARRRSGSPRCPGW